MDSSEFKINPQRNVQEQNSLTKEGIRSEAEYYRHHSIPQALHSYGEAQGIDWNHSIILDLEVDFPGMPSLFGLLLTQKHRFIKFEIETDSQHTKVHEVEVWEDVTDLQNFSEHNQGTGIGYGAMAVSILHDLESKE